MYLYLTNDIPQHKKILYYYTYTLYIIHHVVIMTFLRVPISVYLDPKILSANEVSQHFFRMVRDVSASVSREKKQGQNVL